MTVSSRLSDLNIEDDIVRAYFYGDVLAYSRDGTRTDCIEYAVKLDEVQRPDLLAYRVYGTPDLRWLVSLVADVEDEADPLPVGQVLRFPPAAWLRERIRHYTDGAT